MRKTFLFLLAQLLTIIAIGQEEYYTTDTISFVGLLNLVDTGDKMNARFCQINKNGGIVKYSPYEVKLYCLRSGKLYISKEIPGRDSIRRVFLEQLCKGNLNLYYYKNENGKTFFLEKDSSLIELPRHTDQNRSFREQLQRFTVDCPKLEETAKLVNYRKLSMQQFVKNINTCNRKPFRFASYGISFGYGNANLDVSFGAGFQLPADLQPDPQSVNSIGLFLDFPIMVSNFSFYANVHYFKYSVSYYQFHDKADIDLVVNISTFKMPLMFRYTLPYRQVRPFINAGIVVAYHNQAEFDLYQTVVSPGHVEISEPYSNYFTNLQIGYTAGAGIEYSLNYRNSVFLELRYDKLLKNDKPETVDMSTLFLVAGINF